MPEVEVRKTQVSIETIWHDGGKPVDTPIKVGVASAVVRNPYAGAYVEDILPFMEKLNPLGVELATTLLRAMAVPAEQIESYGKGSIVGVNGELEHAALWHVPGGLGLRKVLGAKSFVPSSKMMGTVGVRLMIPLLNTNTVWVRSHYSVAEFTIHDAPRPNELAVAVAMSSGGRIHARIGGMTKEEGAAEAQRSNK